MMFKQWLEEFETRDLIAIVVISTFTGLAVYQGDLSSTEKLAYLVGGFYFGNKATKDKM